MWRCRGRVKRVVDGDTFVIDIDHGWRIWTIADERKTGIGWIRPLGLDTPEKNEPGFGVATAAAGELLPVGSVVAIESEKLDSFGRSLAHVTLPDGRDFTEAMTQAGHNKLAPSPPPIAEPHS